MTMHSGINSTNGPKFRCTPKNTLWKTRMFSISQQQSAYRYLLNIRKIITIKLNCSVKHCLPDSRVKIAVLHTARLQLFTNPPKSDIRRQIYHCCQPLYRYTETRFCIANPLLYFPAIYAAKLAIYPASFHLFFHSSSRPVTIFSSPFFDVVVVDIFSVVDDDVDDVTAVNFPAVEVKILFRIKQFYSPRYSAMLLN